MNPVQTLTPMMRQWQSAKEKAKDAILLFRMGDFYELFADDALKAAPILELALTSRDKDKGEAAMAMAGFPHHAAPTYIAKLIAAGFKVAICDQLEDPSLKKGIVRRDITRVVTPGTVLDDDSLDPSRNNFLAAIACHNHVFGVAFIDISTGDFLASVTTQSNLLLEEVARIGPSEIVLSSDDGIPSDIITRLEQEILRRPAERISMLSMTKTPLLESLGSVDNWFLDEPQFAALLASEMVLVYVSETQNSLPSHLKTPKPYSIEGQLLIDTTTRRHLEIASPKGDLRATRSLLSVVNKTKTAMGSRRLTRQILAPLTSLEAIGALHDAVGEFVEEAGIRRRLREILQYVYDLERLCAKCSSGRVNPRELGNLRNSLLKLPEITSILAQANQAQIQKLVEQFDILDDICQTLDHALADSPPLSLKDGNVFRRGYDAVLDQFDDLSQGGRDQIAQIERRERETTGITSLKVGYTRVFGYYIEVTKTHLAKVPEHFKRKQTIATGERYVTEELVKLEEQVATAQIKKQQREAELFEALRTTVANASMRLLKVAHLVSELDMLCAFAEVSDALNLVRPKMLPMQERRCKIVQGRHLVVESLLHASGQTFVPNDVELDAKNHQLILLTGPNMGGKSTIMRQVALIQILAQAGCFVPARSAELSICDRIFTRVGASDDMNEGRSTFMVEMHETAHILQNATPNSLVLLDEIGRGTSTYDGLSLAFAVAEYLHEVVKARTLFATHYHELTQLSKQYVRIRNMHVQVSETLHSITFLYALADGAAERSYGIHVAKLAGVPADVVARAQQVLHDLEKDPSRQHKKVSRLTSQSDLFQGERVRVDDAKQLRLNQLAGELSRLDINQLTPLASLNELAKLKQLLE